MRANGGKRDCRLSKTEPNRGDEDRMRKETKHKEKRFSRGTFWRYSIWRRPCICPTQPGAWKQKGETEREPTVSENSKSVLICYDKPLLWNLATKAIFACSLYEYIFVRAQSGTVLCKPLTAFQSVRMRNKVSTVWGARAETGWHPLVELGRQYIKKKKKNMRLS